MAQLTKTWTISKDALVAQLISGSTSYGAGKCLHLPLGRSIAGYGPVRHRSFADFTEDWAGVKRLVKAELKMRRPTAATHVSVGGSAHVRAQRVSAAWSQGTRGADEQIWTDNALEWSNQPGVTGSESPAKAVPAAGEWISVDISAIIDEIAPSEVKKRDGNAGTNGSLASGGGLWEGLRMIATDAAGAEQYDASANASEFFSMESGSDPYVLITHDDNEPPVAPTLTTPAAEDTVQGSSGGTSLVVAGTYSDPDGDAFGGGTLQVYDDATTDDATGAIITGGTKVISDVSMVSGDGSGASWSKTLTGLPRQTWVKVRAQTKDSKGAFSAWSRLRRVKTNATPGIPANPYFQDDTVTSPTIAFSLNDSDPGATIGAYSIEVYYDHPSLGTIPMWIVPKTAQAGSVTRVSVSYNGDPLVVGTTYRWKATTWDNNDTASPPTANLYVTPRTSTGPSNMTPRDVETKQNTKTPTLTIAHGANFDQWALEVYDNPEGTGTPLWSVPTQTVASTASVAKTYGDNTGLTGASTAVALDWGKRYYWRAAIRITGNTTIGAFSPLYPFYVNALPTAPAISVAA
jgi:hypothetical protein